MRSIRGTRSAARSLAVAACALLACGPARAAIAPDAQRIIDRHVEAVGGRAAWEAERARMQHGWYSLSAFGLSGRSEVWLGPDGSASRTTIGPLSLREGFWRGRAWRVDQNGHLSWSDGRELDEAGGEFFFARETWAARDHGGATIVRLPAEAADSGDSLDVLRVTPPTGPPRELSFDRRTGRLARLTASVSGQHATVDMSEYELTAALRRPRHVVIRFPEAPQNTLDQRLDSLVVVATTAADSTLFLPAEHAAATDVRFLGADAHTVRVPIDYSARHVWVLASVNGRPPAPFLLDTGASASCLDSGFAASLGLEQHGDVSVGGAGARGTVHFATVDTLRVPGADGGGGVEIAGQKVIVLPLNRFIAPAFWRDCAGILGYDFITRFVLTIDYAHETMTLDDPASFRPRDAATSLPLTFSGGVPVVHGVLDSTLEGDFRLDVGSGGSVDLHTPFVDAHDLLRDRRTARVTAGGFGGTFDTFVCRMRSLRLGRFVVTEPLVGLSRATEGAFASTQYAGNIGNKVLDRFTCTFDYGGKRILLVPSDRLTRRDAAVPFGASVVRDSAAGDARATYSIAQVVPGSAAEKAGLQAGDVVVRVNDRAIEAYTVDSLGELLEEGAEGSRVRLAILRDGKKKTLRATLQSLF